MSDEQVVAIADAVARKVEERVEAAELAVAELPGVIEQLKLLRQGSAEFAAAISQRMANHEERIVALQRRDVEITFDAEARARLDVLAERLQAAETARPGLEEAIQALREGGAEGVGEFAKMVGGKHAALEERIAEVERGLSSGMANHLRLTSKRIEKLTEDFEKRLAKLEALDLGSLSRSAAAMYENARQTQMGFERGLQERILHVEEVQRANQQGMSDYQRVTTARLDELEAYTDRLERVRQQRYTEVRDFLTGAMTMRHEARGVVIGSFTWAVMQLRKGVHVRRRAWPDAASSVASLQDLIRELDIAPEADLIGMDWEPASGFYPGVA